MSLDALSRSNGEVGVAIVTWTWTYKCCNWYCNCLHGFDSDGYYFGQVPSHAIGQDAFQEVDAVGVTLPMRQT